MSDINIKKVSYLAKLALNDDKAALYEKSLSETSSNTLQVGSGPFQAIMEAN
mgnify:CR=1 FL=1